MVMHPTVYRTDVLYAHWLPSLGHTSHSIQDRCFVCTLITKPGSCIPQYTGQMFCMHTDYQAWVMHPTVYRTDVLYTHWLPSLGHASRSIQDRCFVCTLITKPGSCIPQYTGQMFCMHIDYQAWVMHPTVYRTDVLYAHWLPSLGHASHSIQDRCFVYTLITKPGSCIPQYTGQMFCMHIDNQAWVYIHVTDCLSFNDPLCLGTSLKKYFCLLAGCLGEAVTLWF